MIQEANRVHVAIKDQILRRQVPNEGQSPDGFDVDVC